MNDVAELPQIEASLAYSVDTGVKEVNETYGPNQHLQRGSGGKKELHEVTIRDGRPLMGQFDLDQNGFVFVDHKTKMKNFWDRDELTSVYYAEIEQLIKAQTGATAVHIFDHTLRSGDENTRNEKQVREPVRGVHNDYTEWSGPERVRALLPAEESEALLKHRFAIVQVWRAINQPIQSDPLAICDSRAISEDDLIKVERRHPGRVGETYSIAYNPNHEWYYFPNMTRDEALVFKVYDSATDGRARWSAHTSFPDPTTPPGARPRESLEIRTIASFAPLD